MDMIIGVEKEIECLTESIRVFCENFSRGHSVELSSIEVSKSLDIFICVLSIEIRFVCLSIEFWDDIRDGRSLAMMDFSNQWIISCLQDKTVRNLNPAL